MITPMGLAQNIVDELHFLDGLDQDRTRQLLDAIVKAMDIYGERRFSDGFDTGLESGREESEMAA